MRIVSLLPSATEIICGIGLRDQLVGVSHECDYPADVKRLPKVTQTRIPPAADSRQIDTLVREQVKQQAALYSLDIPILEALKPDLIVTQSICDVCAVAESEVDAVACSLPSKPKIHNLSPHCLADVMRSIREVGTVCGQTVAAEAYVAELHDRIDTVARCSQTIAAADRPSVVLLEWIDPPFSAGHWSPELVELAGGREMIGRAGQRSVTTSWEQIVEVDPEVMVIACCGFDVERTRQDLPILQSQPGWNDLRCVRTGRVHVVDGSAYFNRPGPRLVGSLEILAHLLHPAVHPSPSFNDGFLPKPKANL